MRSTSDEKIILLHLTSIGKTDGRNYGIQDEYQNITLQKELIPSLVFGKVKNTLKRGINLEKCDLL